MALLLNTRAVSKTYGATPLFENVSLTIHDGDRLGLIGPNGSGKSTLLQMLAGRIEPDSGDVVLRKGTRLAYVPQESRFTAGQTPRSVIRAALAGAGVAEAEWLAREAETLGRAGFEDFDTDAAALSGGWQKRLAIAEALVQTPDILLLDEPTNHLDLPGIEWLETLLAGAAFASVTISHDRYFLENVPTATAELSRLYPGEFFYVPGNYSAFLEKKAEFLHAQARRQEALENRVRTEMEWLRRGPKARATKAKARIGKANELIAELTDVQSRTRAATADIDFTASGRKTKRLLHLEGVACGYGDRLLLQDFDFTLTAGTRVGLAGANGSGKTTLLRLLHGDLQPRAGTIRRAEGLRVVYFDQLRQLDLETTLRRALAPESDSVVYRDRVIHVAGWAARFLFTAEQLDQPTAKLSGGERARVLIANLMLEAADVLLLDEPTNDLDIPTLEILEESLLEFPGAMVLVTHDRYLLDRVSTVIVGLDGNGAAGRFADYAQWDAWQTEQTRQAKARSKPSPDEAASRPAPSPTPGKKKLSYMDAREYETIEGRIAAAEQQVAARRAALQDPEVMKDGRALERTYQEMQDAQREVDQLYERWAELEEKR